MTWSAWLHGRWRALLISLRLAAPRPGEKAPTPRPPTRPAWMREEVATGFRVSFAVALVAVLSLVGVSGRWAEPLGIAFGLGLGEKLVWRLPENRLTRDPNRADERSDVDRPDAPGPTP